MESREAWWHAVVLCIWPCYGMGSLAGQVPGLGRRICKDRICRKKKKQTRVPKNTYPVHTDEHALSEYCTCSNNHTAVAGVLHYTRLLASLSSLTEAS